jgi:hypothetical protein
MHIACTIQDMMQVKWADPELQVKKKKAVDDSNADNRMVSEFFSSVTAAAKIEAASPTRVPWSLSRYCE